MILAQSITEYETYNEHAILFEFGGKSFEAVIVDNEEETFVSECLLLERMKKPIEIDMPKFFGGFSSDIFKLLYDRVHEPIDENDVEYVESSDDEDEG